MPQRKELRRAVADGVRVNGLSPTEPPPTSGPLIVAPIRDASGVVRSLLALDELPASRFNDSTASVFFGIAEWIAASLKRISRGEKPFDFRAAISDLSKPVAWMGTADELAARLVIEDARCSRLGLTTSLIALQATDFRPADAGDLARQ